MSELLRLGALEVTFALVFTVLALVDVAHLRRQSKQLLRRIEMSRLEARSLAELSAKHAGLQRQYSQARALIYLMGEFNQVMAFQAVLDRLSRGLSQFFAGDDVAVWIRSPSGNFELAAAVRDDAADLVSADTAWLSSVLADGSVVIAPAWQRTEGPWMAAPILDWWGSGLGVIVLTSRRRSAYTVEDGEFLRAVVGHAAMAIQNAARFEIADRRARLDPLTGLGNRGDFDRALHDALTRALLAAGSLSILLADIDHFKEINDSRGHPEGDRVLRHVARLIAQSAGEPGRAFRIGGEEFAVLLTQTKAAAVSVALLLCARVAQEAFFDDGTRLTLSIGVASLPEDGRDPAALMLAADQALYQAKAAGRNRVHAA
jgi:diguanylate cyclase (GGDEF)-like protein